MKMKARGGIEMTAAMMISGTIGVFVLFSGQPVVDVVFWRCAFGAVTLLVVCAVLGLLRGDVISRRQFGLAAIGGVAIVLNWVLLFAAYSRASISIATAVYNTQPFMLVAMGALFFSERLTPAKIGWLGLAFLGMLAVVQSKTGTSYGGSSYLVGILFALGAAFFYAVAAIVTKKLKGVPPHLIALIQVAVGMTILAPMTNFSTLPNESMAWVALVTVGVVHTGLVYILLYGAIQKLPTDLIGSLSFIYPIVAILVDVIFLGHRLQPLQMVGAAAILLSAAGSNLGWSIRPRRLGRHP